MKGTKSLVEKFWRWSRRILGIYTQLRVQVPHLLSGKGKHEDQYSHCQSPKGRSSSSYPRGKRRIIHGSVSRQEYTPIRTAVVWGVTQHPFSCLLIVMPESLWEKNVVLSHCDKWNSCSSTNEESLMKGLCRGSGHIQEKTK